MNKKGFTLVEMVGVLLLLAIIASIMIPVVRRTINNSKQKLYDEQINQIESGLKDWASNNIYLLPENTNDVIYLSLGQLRQSGNAEIKIANPKNNKCFGNETLLSITRKNNTYVYNVDNLVEIDCNDSSDSPVINMNGEPVIYINIGSTYTDLGATAKSNGGTNLTSSMTTTISGSGSTINTASKSSYKITYKITDGNKSMTAIRNVLVR